MPARRKSKKTHVSRKPSHRRRASKRPVGETKDSVLARLKEKFPVADTVDMYRRKSWEMFAQKLADAYNQKTMLFMVTVNPDMLELREQIEAAFPCKICSPTEGLYTGGFDFITRG